MPQPSLLARPRKKNNRRRRLFRSLRLWLQTRKIPNVTHFQDNAVQLYPHGGDFFPALFQAIDTAEEQICAEFYIVRDDATGRAFAKHLKMAVGRGIEVRLIYDYIGSYETATSFFDDLAESGVHCRPFNVPAVGRLRWLDRRDHRKQLLIDGKTAFLGGINIGNEYAGYGENYQRWRDVGIRLEGPCVTELARIFCRTWKKEGGEAVPESVLCALASGEADVTIFNGTAQLRRSAIRGSFRLAMAGATESIQIVTPYFLPGVSVVRSLLKAVRRGVQVQLILPSISDVPVVKLLSRAYLAPLQKAGVDVYERQHTILHAKIMQVDGFWVLLGSANLDFRSFHRNLELNLIIDCARFGQQVRALLQEELHASRRILRDEMMKRGLIERLLEWVLSPLDKFL